MNHYQKFYNCLEEATLDAIEPNMVLTLTGGLDTRVIAGILNVNGIKMPALAYGSHLENTIAGCVASMLGFDFYCCSKTERFSTFSYLKGRGFQYLLRGSYFDEMNGGWTGYKAKTREEFEIEVQKWLRRAGLGVPSTDPVILIGRCPILDPKVRDCLSGTPWQVRKGKGLQMWILKNKFPKLWRVIYYDSMLPPCFPFPVHAIGESFLSRRIFSHAIRRGLNVSQN